MFHCVMIMYLVSLILTGKFKESSWRAIVGRFCSFLNLQLFRQLLVKSKRDLECSVWVLKTRIYTLLKSAVTGS